MYVLYNKILIIGIPLNYVEYDGINDFPREFINHDIVHSFGVIKEWERRETEQK